MRSAPVTHLPNSFAYEQCDIPAGTSIAEWRATRPRSSNRRAQVVGGLVGAAATLGPLALSLRGIRSGGHH